MKCSICGSNNVYWSDYTNPSTVCPDCGAINSVAPEKEEGTDGRCTFDE